MRRVLVAMAMAMVVALMATAHAAERWGDAMAVKEQIKKFAPVKIEVDPQLLTPKQQKLAQALVKASRIMDEIFLRQVWTGNVALRDKLAKAGADAEPFRKYFAINAGPFDRLDHNKPFIDGVPQKPKGAAFYPENLTKEEFETWVKRHPEDKDAFESNFTVIKRDGGNLVAVPYSQEYKEWLVKAADALRAAAKLADTKDLKRYLEARADAFLSNDYYQSDVEWVRMKDSAFEVVIGPYEVYEDDLLGYKAAFEAYVTRVDPEESKRFSKVIGYLDALQKNLPVEKEYQGSSRGLSSPIVVTQAIFTAGDANKGVKTLAFNLPNDERVRKDEGSKKVMMKNVQHAKFDKILVPIAKALMRPDDVKNVDFEAFFAHTLLHEVAHTLGPGEITKGGTATTVNKALQDAYSTIEECKADTLAAYNALYLIDQGLYAKDFAQKMWPTYLAGLFRSVRFGINEAHGGSNAIQINYLWDKGGFLYDKKSGSFGVDAAKMTSAIRDLARELLMFEAKGDYSGAKKFIAKYRVIRPELKSALARLKDVPVDLDATYAY